MNRRDFAKGFVMLPFVGHAQRIAKMCSTKACHTDGPYLLVILEGPFALVLGTGTPYKVTAFTPRHDGRHLLAVNGEVSSSDAKYGFRLLPEGLASTKTSPCIYPCYPGFYAEHTPCHQNRKDHFVSVDLPVPAAAFVMRSPSKATMESNENFPMPGAHMLVYQITDPKAVKMFGSEGDDIVEVPTKKFWKWPAFRIEVGLPNLLGMDSDPDGSHAIDFYNSGLLPYFPELVNDKSRRIKEIATDTTKHQEVDQVLGGETLGALAESISTTTTFECKIGGLTATSP